MNSPRMRPVIVEPAKESEARERAANIKNNKPKER